MRTGTGGRVPDQGAAWAFHHGLVSYPDVKYANQINTALVVASALFVVYILTQTYWSTDPAEEIVRPIRQEESPAESPSPEVSMPGSERRSPAPRRLPPPGSETAPVEPSATGSTSAPPAARVGNPARRPGGRPQTAAPRRLTPTPSRTTPLGRSPASRTSRVPPVTPPSGSRPARPLIRPPREIVPEEKRQTGDPAPIPPVRSSAPEQRLPGP